MFLWNGADPSGVAPAGRTRTVRAGETGHPLRPAPGERGRPVELTASEYALLRALSLNEGRVSGYEALVRQVSGKHYNRDARVALRSLVKNLRRKLGDDAGDPAYILNKRGVGYRMPRPDGP